MFMSFFIIFIIINHLWWYKPKIHTTVLLWSHMSIMASQITSHSVIYSTPCLGKHQTKHERSASLTLCEGNPPVIGGFPSQRASNTESIFMLWQHHAAQYGSGNCYLCYSWYSKCHKKLKITCWPFWIWSMHLKLWIAKETEESMSNFTFMVVSVHGLAPSGGRTCIDTVMTKLGCGIFIGLKGFNVIQGCCCLFMRWMRQTGVIYMLGVVILLS